MNCPTCQTALSQEVKFCPNCGSLVSENCSACGRKLSEGEKFCPNCGTASRNTSTGLSESGAISAGGSMSHLSRDLSNISQDARNIKIPSVELSTGDVIDEQFKVEKKLGQGGYGGVYQVFNQVVNKTQALKVIPYIDESSAKNILLEFESRNKIQDFEYIARGYQPQRKVYDGQDIIIYSMELADMSLRDWMIENKGKHGQKMQEGLEYFRQACEGLSAIHRAGMLHLDIKPENILLVKEHSKEDSKEEKYKVKITDFGLSRGLGALHLELLQDGAGTAVYMAPEQIQAARWKDVDKSADIYSMGLLLYEIIDGVTPYSGSAQQIKQKKLQDIKPGKLKGQGEIYWKIIERCIQKDSDDRYSSIGDLILDFDRLLIGKTTSDDIRCKKCNHLNSNTDLKYCEKCGDDITDFFEPCSRCAKMVRIDVDNCPGCGYDIGKERLHLIRKERLESLKDEDPVEAIALLEEMLKDNYNVGEKEVLLVKELREKQERISKLIQQANDPELLTFPEKSLEKWEDILKIIPRHRVAKKRIAELKELIKGTSSFLNRANTLSSKAKFKDARKALEEGLEKNPVKEPLREAIKKLDENEKHYFNAMLAYDKSKEAKLLNDAEMQLVTALKYASSCPKAMGYKKNIEQLLSDNKKSEEQAKNGIEEGEFEISENYLEKIIKTQSDNKEYSKIKSDLQKKKDEFPPKVKNAQELYAQKKLPEALEEVKKALILCPKNKTANKLKNSIETDIDLVKNLLTSAKKSSVSADFQKSKNDLSKANNLWVDNSEINSVEQEITKLNNEYKTAIDKANSNLKQNKFKEALSYAEKSIELCPESDEAKNLKNDIEIKEIQYHRKKGEQAAFMKEASLWAVTLLPGLLAMAFFIGYDYNISIFGLDVPDVLGIILFPLFIVISALIQIKDSYKGIANRIKYKNWIGFSKGKMFFSLLSIISFPVMIIATMTNMIIAFVVLIVWNYVLSNISS